MYMYMHVVCVRVHVSLLILYVYIRASLQDSLLCIDCCELQWNICIYKEMMTLVVFYRCI
jgi:hypothetical protein